MTKTPDEIKKGLECCGTGKYGNHKDCPYDIAEPQCMQRLLADALALIQHKEQENAEQAEKIRRLEASLMYEMNETKLIHVVYSDDDAAKVIQQFEAKNAELLENIKWMEAERDDFKRYIKQLEAERDAAVKDMSNCVVVCNVCKHKKACMDVLPCNACSVLRNSKESRFEWRGVQKEG